MDGRGTVYQRGKVYWIKYYRHGKPYYESSKSTKKTVANTLLKTRLGEIASGRLPGIHFEKVTFEELAEDFLRDRRVNGKGGVEALKRLRHLKTFFRDALAVEVTTPEVNEYVEARMEAGAASATINRELAALKRMLRLGARQTPPKVDRVPHISLLKENNVRKGFFEHGDFLALREAVPDYLKDFITFAYKTGWRVSEVAGLTWTQVDRKQGIVRLEVGDSKNDEGRTVYLDEELKETLDRLWEERKQAGILLPFVFLNGKGDDQIKRFDKSWRKGCKDAGIGKRLFHDFRRTAVRNMVRAGIPERVAMLLSGHKTRSVFERYNIVNDADLKMAKQRQEEYFKRQTVTKTVTIAKIREKREAA